MSEPREADGGEIFLRTPRLALRRFRPGDADSFAAYRGDPEVARYQGWESCTRGDAVAFASDGSLIGDCALRMESAAARQAELGFTFAREYQGRGFATEAVSHLLGYAFARLGLHRIFAVADARNLRALALVERVGMR